MDSKTIVNVGVQQFDKVIEENKFYIDKTGFIREWWEYGSDVTLITRPRRFGKTLNMSMTQCFFSNKYANRGDLFEGLSIWREEKYRQIQGTFPVIFLSFSSVKTGETEEMKKAVKIILSNIYSEYSYIMKSNLFNDNDRETFVSVNEKMDDVTAYTAINRLCIYLAKYYNKNVIILLDEYDTPMQESWLAGNWDEAVMFFRKFFNNTFKTNPYLHRGLITGITRISKESIFSDLNNLKVATTTSNKYASSFGFTEEEVFGTLDNAGLGNEKLKVKQWYDEFTFGKYTDIYNPWSIASFIENDCKYDTYWADTSSNGLVNSLIQGGNPEIKRTMEDLLQGGAFRAEIDEQVVFNQLNGSTNAVWSLLLATGYLKVLKLETIESNDGIGDEGDVWYTLALTNHEVRRMFRKMVKDWFDGTTEVYYNEFIRALLDDNVRKMNTFMNKVAMCTFSFFDSGNRPSGQAEPERLASCCDRMGTANGSSLCGSANLQCEADASQFYHGFVLGMVVNLAKTYRIRSNRESGYGRYDVMLEPLDKKGKAFIFEFKVLDPDEDEMTLEDTLASVLSQIEEKQYEAELIAGGLLPERIRKYGFAFRGKECLIGQGK